MPTNLTGLTVHDLQDFAAKPTPPSAEQRAAQEKQAALDARPSLRGGTPLASRHIARPEPPQ